MNWDSQWKISAAECHQVNQILSEHFCFLNWIIITRPKRKLEFFLKGWGGGGEGGGLQLNGVDGVGGGESPGLQGQIGETMTVAFLWQRLSNDCWA